MSEESKAYKLSMTTRWHEQGNPEGAVFRVEQMYDTGRKRVAYIVALDFADVEDFLARSGMFETQEPPGKKSDLNITKLSGGVGLSIPCVETFGFKKV